MIDPSPPSTQTDSAAHLISLVTNQDQVVHNWVQLLVGVQAGLAVAVGFLLKPGDGTVEIPWFAVVAVPVLGIIAAIALVTIIVHEQKWQVWFAQRFTKLPGLPQVFPDYPAHAANVSDIPLTFIGKVVVAFGTVVSALWLVLLIALLSQPPRSAPPCAAAKTMPAVQSIQPPRTSP
jgi:Ca2+/Na+ antiporter